MALSDLVFIFVFFPILFIIYYLSQNRFRKYELLLASLLFYVLLDPLRLWVVLSITLISYCDARLIAKERSKSEENDTKHERYAKVLLLLGVICNLLPLFYYRYLSFAISSIGSIFNIDNIWQKKDFGVPVGLSFITFSAISYIADVYNKKVNAERSICSLATYILMFPKLIMGPIERYDNISDCIDHPDLSAENASNGIKRFIIGFSKKIIIADNLAVIVDQAFSTTDYASAPTLFLWLGAICFSLQLFFDFSGYSDMAIGLASLFGFHFKENFDYPYISKSITEFWRRWHISLSSWFRDYVYIPLGGSRRSLIRNIINLLIVWALTGIWHGAGNKFIVWGFVYFVMLLVERYVIRIRDRRNKLFKAVWMIITLLVVNFNWVIFHADSLESGIQYCLNMMGRNGLNLTVNNTMIADLREYWFYIILALLFSTPVARIVFAKISKKDKHGITMVISTIGYLFVFAWGISFVLLGSHNPFLYQQF